MHSPTQIQWDDLQHFLALAHHGSTLAAGRALGVDQSTVQRRLSELERRIGQSLVQRQATGYRLTEFGYQMLPFAEAVEDAVCAFERQVETWAGETTGVVRMTCPEPIVNRITQTGMIERLHARHPALKLQFLMSDHYMDLHQGDADVALRSGDTDDGQLVGRKIGDSVWAVYASKAYIAQRGQPERIQDLSKHALVGLDDTMAKHRLSLWLREVAPHAELVSRSSSVLGLVYSVKAGLGVGALPLPLGDAEPDLVRVLGPVPELIRIWRVLTTPELRRTPRVSALFDFIVDEIETLRPILTG